MIKANELSNHKNKIKQIGDYYIVKFIEPLLQLSDSRGLNSVDIQATFNAFNLDDFPAIITDQILYGLGNYAPTITLQKDITEYIVNELKNNGYKTDFYYKNNSLSNMYKTKKQGFLKITW